MKPTTNRNTPRARFQPRGMGVFTCRICSRSTRDTGDNGNTRLCPQCYDLGGLINEALDTNPSNPRHADIHREQNALRAQIVKLGGVLGKNTECYCDACETARTASEVR